MGAVQVHFTPLISRGTLATDAEWTNVVKWLRNTVISEQSEIKSSVILQTNHNIKFYNRYILYWYKLVMEAFHVHCHVLYHFYFPLEDTNRQTERENTYSTLEPQGHKLHLKNVAYYISYL